MTAAQEEKFERVKEILGEHFDAYVVVASWKKDDGINVLGANYGGGYFTALGLLHSALKGFSQDENED